MPVHTNVAVAGVGHRHNSSLHLDKMKRLPSSSLRYHINHSDENEVGTMMAPHETHLLTQTVMKKQANDGRWLPRRVALTENALHIGREGDIHHEIIDSIPLDEVALIEIVSHNDGLKKQEPGKERLIKRKSFGGSFSGTLPNLTNVQDSENQGQTASDAVPTTPAAPSTPAALSSTHSGGNRKQSVLGSSIFRICTVEGGFNGGTRYTFEADDAAQCLEWVTAAEAAVKKALERKRNANLLTHARSSCNDLLQSRPVEITVVVLISLNFVLNVLEAQVQFTIFVLPICRTLVVHNAPRVVTAESVLQILTEEGGTAEALFYWLDFVLTALFSVELAINLFANWLTPFFSDTWSVFDLLVVAFSWIAIAASTAGLSSLRVVRVFRTLKLVGRVKNLRKIIDALAASIGPVMNALLICAIVNAIFAICAVQFFRERSDYHFGTFARATYTMFLMATYDYPFKGDLSLYNADTEEWDYGYTLFFSLYVVVSVWTLLQVIMAVLLDNFVAASANIRQEEIERENAMFKLEDHPLDPLLEELTKQYHTAVDLNERMFQLYQRMDIDGTGSLGYDDVKEGLNRLDFGSTYQMSKEEWDTITGTVGFSGDHRLTPPEFIKVMRKQLKIHVQKNVANATVTCPDDFQRAVLLALKVRLTDESTTTRDYRLTKSPTAPSNPNDDNQEKSKGINGDATVKEKGIDAVVDSQVKVNSEKEIAVVETTEERNIESASVDEIPMQQSEGKEIKILLHQLFSRIDSIDQRLCTIENTIGKDREKSGESAPNVEADMVFWDLFTSKEKANGSRVTPVASHNEQPRFFDFT